MAIPPSKKIVDPLLAVLGDGKIHTLKKIDDALSGRFGLTAEERAMRTRSGNRIFRVRITSLLWRLRQEGLVENTSWAKYKLTASGLSQSRSPSKAPKFSLTPETGQAQSLDLDDPVEAIEHHIDSIKRATKEDLLKQTRQCTDSTFETLVVQILVKMGYGGSREDAGRTVGRSHDGGIDGVIKEDKLGLDKIYIQAKQWGGNVGSAEVQKFLGALDTKHATKGVLITTSDFTSAARAACDSSTKSLILINGDELVEYMFRDGIGVRLESTHEIKKIDPGFFEDL